MRTADFRGQRRWRTAAVSAAAAVILLTTGVPAAADERPRVPLQEQTVRQKAMLLQNLISGSVAAKRIESSNDAAAKAALDEARELVGEANDHLSQGDIGAGDTKLNAALELVNAQTRRLSQTEVSGAHEKRVYEKRIKSIHAFIDAYDRVAKQMAADGQGKDFSARVALADDAAKREDYAHANDILDGIYPEITRQLKEWRDGRTLTKSLNFASPKEEYLYEIDRNDSHFMLLKLAQKDLPPLPGAGNYIAGLQQQAEGLREESEQVAGGGNYEKAIDLLEQSTSRLLNAIRMSGLFIPG